MIFLAYLLFNNCSISYDQLDNVEDYGFNKAELQQLALKILPTKQLQDIMAKSQSVGPSKIQALVEGETSKLAFKVVTTSTQNYNKAAELILSNGSHDLINLYFTAANKSLNPLLTTGHKIFKNIAKIESWESMYEKDEWQTKQSYFEDLLKAFPPNYEQLIDKMFGGYENLLEENVTDILKDHNIKRKVCKLSDILVELPNYKTSVDELSNDLSFYERHLWIIFKKSTIDSFFKATDKVDNDYIQRTEIIKKIITQTTNDLNTYFSNDKVIKPDTRRKILKRIEDYHDEIIKIFKEFVEKGSSASTRVTMIVLIVLGSIIGFIFLAIIGVWLYQRRKITDEIDEDIDDEIDEDDKSDQSV